MYRIDNIQIQILRNGEVVKTFDNILEDPDFKANRNQHTLCARAEVAEYLWRNTPMSVIAIGRALGINHARLGKGIFKSCI